MESALCVLQASDLRLDEPITGVPGLPTDLFAVAAAARQRAAARVFAAARESCADLLLLTGPLANVSEEPRLALWLADEFKELERRGVAIVWARSGAAANCLLEQHLPALRILGPQQSIAFPLPRQQAAVELHWNRADAGFDQSRERCDLLVSLQGDPDRLDVSCLTRGALHGSRLQTLPLQRSGYELGAASGYWRIHCELGSRALPTLHSAATVAWQALEIETQRSQSATTLAADIVDRLHRIQAQDLAELTFVRVNLGVDASLAEELWRSGGTTELLRSVRNLARLRNVWCEEVTMQPRDGSFAQWGSDPLVNCGLSEHQLAISRSSGSNLPAGWTANEWSQREQSRMGRALKMRVVAELARW